MNSANSGGRYDLPLLQRRRHGAVTIDPIDGKESTMLVCSGPVPHTRPFEPKLSEVFAFRARVWQLMEAA